VTADAALEIDERGQFEPAYRRLREEVLSGQLAPGSRISQVQIARQYGMSRSPLREALRMLQREGLVEGALGKRSTIAPLSGSDLEQLYAMRIMVEGLAIRLTVASASDEQVEVLRGRLDEMADEQQSRDFDAWEIPHRAFHRALLAGGGERLTAMAAELSDQAGRYRRVFLREPRAWSVAAEEHTAIFEAFAARKAAAAAHELASHLAKTALTVAATLAPDHEPTGVREALRMVTPRVSG
jgi:DNA-binding GntR family transcriptional regulator